MIVYAAYGNVSQSRKIRVRLTPPVDSGSRVVDPRPARTSATSQKLYDVHPGDKRVWALSPTELAPRCNQLPRNPGLALISRAILVEPAKTTMHGRQTDLEPLDPLIAKHHRRPE